MKFKRAFKALYEDAKEKYDIQQAPKLILSYMFSVKHQVDFCWRSGS